MKIEQIKNLRQHQRQILDDIKRSYGVIEDIVPADKFESLTKEIDFVLRHEAQHETISKSIKAEKQVQNFSLQTIKVKYLGPTNHRGARVKASTANGESVTLAYDYGKTGNHNYDDAALKLATDLGWTRNCNLIGGCFGNDYFYNLVPK